MADFGIFKLKPKWKITIKSNPFLDTNAENKMCISKSLLKIFSFPLQIDISYIDFRTIQNTHHPSCANRKFKNKI